MFTACGTKEEEVKVDVPEQVESTVENVEIVEEVADVKNEEPSDNENKNVYKDQMGLIYQALSQEWSVIF